MDGERVYGQVGALSRGSVGNKAVLGAPWGSYGTLERLRVIRWEPQCAGGALALEVSRSDLLLGHLQDKSM